jgi:hypothetical protein
MNVNQGERNSPQRTWKAQTNGKRANGERVKGKTREQDRQDGQDEGEKGKRAKWGKGERGKWGKDINRMDRMGRRDAETKKRRVSVARTQKNASTAGWGR